MTGTRKAKTMGASQRNIAPSVSGAEVNQSHMNVTTFVKRKGKACSMLRVIEAAILGACDAVVGRFFEFGRE